MDSVDVVKGEKIARELDPDHITVTSGVFEVPVDEDGTISLANIRAQLPGASGLWFPSDDKHRRRVVRYDKKNNKLLPPDGHWTDRTYNVSYSSTSGFMGEKELERYEVASRLLHKSVESVSKLMQQAASASVDHVAHRTMEGFQNYPIFLMTFEDGSSKIPRLPWKVCQRFDLHLFRAQWIYFEFLYVIKCTVASMAPDFRPEHLHFLRFERPEDVQKEMLLSENVEKGIGSMKATIANRGAKVLELENRCEDHEKILKEKNKEIEDLKKRLEKKEQEFEFLTVPSEGFGDTRVAQELHKIRKQLDDTKWRCGELDAALTAKNRENQALKDWKREAEGTIHRLETEHEFCNSKREKLENTVHALHQFALIMKKEAEMAKQKAGFDQNFRLFLAQDNDDAGGERAEEKVKRFEKDLDVACDNLNRQAEEIEHYKWKCSELETSLTARDKELKLIIKEAFNKEKMLRSEIDAAQDKSQSQATSEPVSTTQAFASRFYLEQPETVDLSDRLLDAAATCVPNNRDRSSPGGKRTSGSASIGSSSLLDSDFEKDRRHLSRMPSCTSTTAEEFNIVMRNGEQTGATSATDTPATTTMSRASIVSLTFSHDFGLIEEKSQFDSEKDVDEESEEKL